MLSVYPVVSSFRGLTLFFKKLFIFGCTGSLLPCAGFSLVAASRGYSLVGVRGLLIVVASLVAEQGL